MSKPPIRVAVTGAAGQIGYSLLFRIAAGNMRDVLTGMIKAHEIQGVLALENSFNRVGLDHVVLVKVASTAVVAHMGVLPLQFRPGDSVESLGIKGDETFDIAVPQGVKPQQELTLVITRKDGTKQSVPVLCRIDTPIEVDYYLHGGILPYVLRDLVAKSPAAAVTA